MKKTLFKPDTLFIIGLALAVFAAFAPGLSCGFLVNWDDGAYTAPLLSCTDIAKYFFGTITDVYAPIPVYSLMLDKFLFGEGNALPYHLHNILLQCACTVLLFLIIRRLGVNIKIAFFCALIWAVNPQKVESVVWITERKDLLCGLFSFASFYCFMKAFSKDKMSWAAGIFAAIAMFCKAAAAALPGVIILYAICLRRNRMDIKKYFSILAFPVLMSAAALLWSMHVTAGTRPFELETDIFVPIHNFLWYFMTPFIPYELNPIYPVVEGFKDCVIPLAGTALLLFLFVPASKKAKISWIVTAGFILAAGGVMLPVAGILKYGYFQYCDRFTYMVSAVLAAWLAVIASALLKKHIFNLKNICAVLACWGMIFIVAAWMYIPSWENDETFAESIISNSSPCGIEAFGTVGMIAINSSNTDMLKRFSVKLAQDKEYYAGTGFQDTAEAYIHAFSGCIAIAERRNADALKDFNAAYAMFSTGKAVCPPGLFYRLLIIMTPVFYVSGDKAKVTAIADTLKRLELKDGIHPSHGIYALAAQIKGDRQTLLREFEAMLKEDPDNVRLKAKYEEEKAKAETAK